MTESKRKNKHAGGRPRTGSLVWRKSGWSARYWTQKDGEWIRVCVALGTDNKAVARRKLARLLEAEGATALDVAKRIETFEEAARASVKLQAAEGLATWKDRLHRLEVWAFPTLGQMPVDKLRPPHVLEALEACQRDGRSRRTIMHLKIDISTVLDSLWREEQIPENVARKVRVPKNARVDERRRVVLADDEFEALLHSPHLGAELATMAYTSRTFGGMRTSDLHAWDWKHIDTQDWADAHVPRPKTKSSDRLALPESFVPVLKAWWRQHGSPTAGPVFPVRKGPRAGKRKQGKTSYAWHLREALWLAGIVRPLDGFEKARAAWQAAQAELERAVSRRAERTELDARIAAATAAEGRARKLCLIQAGSEDYKPLDFHSFRRAFATGLADAGVNVQQAMALAGHRTASTHMRYVRITEVLEVPTAALPNFQKASAVPFALLPRSPNQQVFSAHPVGFEPTTLGFEVRCSIQLS
jgi:integrase